MRTRLITVFALVPLLAVLTACGGGGPTTTVTVTTMAPTIAPAITTPSAAAVPTEIEIPEVKGKNALIVQQEMRKAGFENVTLSSATPGTSLVILPQNWTAQSVEPKAGTVVAADAPIVVKVTKE